MRLLGDIAPLSVDPIRGLWLLLAVLTLGGLAASLDDSCDANQADLPAVELTL